ncbi:MAG: TonB-dependent receptor, partial [Cellvibrio sp.]|nr:TonB-dependent receptor [Cellvibrio sp.]
VFEGTNIVKSRSVSGQYMFTSGDLSTGKTDSFVYALGGDWDIGSNLKVKSELVYQDSEFSTDFVGMRFDKGGYQLDIDFNAGGGLPAYSFPDNPATAAVNESDLTDLVAWNSAQFYDSGTRNTGDATTFTTDATYTTDFSIFTAFDFGIRIDERTAAEARRLMYNDQMGVIDNAYSNAIHIESIDGLASINKGFFDGQADVPTTWAAANGHYLKSNIDDVRAMYGVSKGPLVEDFNVEEVTTSAYVTAKFDSELAGKTIDGEIGLRYTGSDTDIEFGDQPSSSDTSTVLPSLMIRYHWTDSLESRFAYTETLRRPAFNQLNGNIILSPDITNIGYGTARGGNADLEPTESQNYDFSLEWYFADSSSLYGTLFKREIEGFVIDFRRQVQLADANGVVDTYVLSQPYNASNGELTGLELGAVWFPDNLPSVLDGFGIQASYTALDSSQTTPVTDATGEITDIQETDLFGVSDESYSVVLAYDKYDVGVRLSYAWRSEFLNNYEAALFANPIEVWRKPESSLDLQISYDVNDNLSLTLDGTNLTEEIYQSYYGENGSTTNNFGSSLYSRTFAIGARLTF